MREANIDGEREGWTHSPSEADMYLPPRVMDRRAHLGIGEMRERRAAPPAPGTRRARRHTRRWGMPPRHRAHSEHHSTEGPRPSPQRLPLALRPTARFQETLRYLDLCQHASGFRNDSRFTEPQGTLESTLNGVMTARVRTCLLQLKHAWGLHEKRIEASDPSSKPPPQEAGQEEELSKPSGRREGRGWT